jgi:hypothetical protein
MYTSATSIHVYVAYAHVVRGTSHRCSRGLTVEVQELLLMMLSGTIGVVIRIASESIEA